RRHTRLQGDWSSDVCSSDLANPGKSTISVSGAIISTKTYIVPPNADEPGCSGCVDTNDTRISGTPVFQKGLISFSLNTGLNNGRSEERRVGKECRCGRRAQL